jgi:hypothetical protein
MPASDAEARAEQATGLDKSFLRTKLGPMYEPFVEAYAVDPANDLRSQFIREAKSGKATLEAHMLTQSGIRMPLRMNESATKAFATAKDIEERGRFIAGPIREQARNMAREALKKLHESGDISAISPRAEWLLREAGAVYDEQYEDHGRIRNRVRIREDIGNLPALNPGPGGWPGLYGDAAFSPPGGILNDVYLAYGPSQQQLYLSDQWDMIAKAFWSWHHHPTAKQGIDILVEFVLGRGVVIICEDTDIVEPALKKFWTDNGMDRRLNVLAQDFFRDGETFVRPIGVGDGRTRVRTCEPSTMWEIVTDWLDIEDVFYYRQQFQTRTQLYAPPGSRPGQGYVLRDFTPDEIIHAKINVAASEVRGRSDLFPALGWLKLLSDYFTTVVVSQQTAAAQAFDISVAGGLADIQAAMTNFTIPSVNNPGSANFHSDNITVETIGSDKAGGGSAAAGSTYAGLMTMAAQGMGAPRQYLGVEGQSASRTTSLTATEPIAKKLQTRQDILRDIVVRVIKSALQEMDRFGLLDGAKSLAFEVEFPEIVSSDTPVKLEALRMGESMDYISKRTAAEAYAAELDMRRYDFDQEQKKIQDERKAAIAAGTHPTIAAKYAQAEKGPLLPPKETDPDDPDSGDQGAPGGSRDQSTLGQKTSGDIRKRAKESLGENLGDIIIELED